MLKIFGNCTTNEEWAMVSQIQVIFRVLNLFERTKKRELVLEKSIECLAYERKKNVRPRKSSYKKPYQARGFQAISSLIGAHKATPDICHSFRIYDICILNKSHYDI